MEGKLILKTENLVCVSKRKNLEGFFLPMRILEKFTP